MHDDNYLPLEAAPHFIRLLILFNKSLQELLDMFHAQENEMAFARLLDHLVNDFDYYQETYTHWQKTAGTSAERDSLNALEPLMQEAKDLIAEAVALIKH